MKTPLTLLVALCATLPVWAQVPVGGVLVGPYTPQELDQLVAPIALYPDPLIALILPASTDLSDIALAASYDAANGDPAGIDAQPWDPSVKGLAHYPQVVEWMYNNIAWTQTLGLAFAQQPADVMKSIQQMRAQALAAGTLDNTPQQQIDQEGDDIRIIPVQPDVIYVPEYDYNLVYGEVGGYTAPLVTFSVGFPVGPWLGYECDWDDFGVWIGPWAPGWAYRRDWKNRNGNPWRIDPGRWQGLQRNLNGSGGNLPAPASIGRQGAPVRNPGVGPAVIPRAPVAAPSSRPDYRGYGTQAAPQSPAPAPSGALYGGYDRGTDTRSYSTRGQQSLAAPVRSVAPAPVQRAPAPAPAQRAPAPAPAERERH
jgi:hypothetical protein